MRNQISRYGIAIGIGVAVTFGLLFIMQYMIASGHSGLNDSNAMRIVDFVRVERTEVIEKKKEKPDKPPEPEVQPQMPEPQISISPTTLRIAMVQPPETMRTSFDGISFGTGDGEYLPMFKPQPLYPQRAAQRGLEGYVVVEYTVTAQGETKDVRVVESSNGVFERPAVESATRYRYRPRVVDGIAYEVTGVRTRIEFKLTG